MEAMPELAWDQPGPPVSAGRPVPGAARFADQVAGLTRGGSRLDLGDHVRAVLEGGVLRAERDV